MSEETQGKIEILVTDTENGPEVSFSTNMSLPDMNFYLDHVKWMLFSGEVQLAS